jgi:hypothetical protein
MQKENSDVLAETLQNKTQVLLTLISWLQVVGSYILGRTLKL